MKCQGITEENKQCERKALIKYCEIHSDKKNRKRKKIIQCPKCKSEKIERRNKNRCLECGNKW